MKNKYNRENNTSFILFTIVIILFALIVVLTCNLVSLVLADKRNAENEMHILNGTVITQPCKITFSVQYDKEPVDLQLISPTNITYTSTDYNADITDDGTTICLSIITEETGNWRVGYNHKSNNHCKPTLSTDYVDQLFLTNIDITQENNKFYISMIPLFGDGSLIKELGINVTFNSNKTRQSCIVFDEPIMTNKPVTFELNTHHIKNSDDWKLKITTYNPDNLSDENYIYSYQSNNYYTYQKN